MNIRNNFIRIQNLMWFIIFIRIKPNSNNRIGQFFKVFEEFLTFLIKNPKRIGSYRDTDFRKSYYLFFLIRNQNSNFVSYLWRIGIKPSGIFPIRLLLNNFQFSALFSNCDFI